MKRTLSFLLVLSLMMGLGLMGCANKGNQTDQPVGTTAAPKTEDQTKPTESEEDDVPQQTKYDPVIEVMVNMVEEPTLKLPEGESIDNNYYTRWTESALGIKYKPQWISAGGDAERQKLSLALASGDMPDVIHGSVADIMKMAKAGALMPIDDLIEQYASPLTKYVIEEFQQALDGRYFAPVTLDGKIYGLPAVADVWANTASAIWMRQDILDELGLKAPTTLDEYEDILAAYKAKYPDNVGVITTKDLEGIYMTVMDPYGAMPFKWIEGADGKLVYGSLQPETKNGLARLRDWYAKGYLDREFVVKDFGKSIETMVSGNALSMEGRWWYLHWPLPDMANNVPAAKMVTVPALKGPDGSRQISIGNPMPLNMTAIRKDFEHPESQILQLNEFLDSSLRGSKEIRDMMKTEFGYEFKYPYEQARQPSNLSDIKNEDGGYAMDQGVWDYEMPGPRGYFNTIGLNAQHAFRGFFMLELATSIISMFDRVKEAVENNALQSLDQNDLNQHVLLSEKPLNLMRNLFVLMEDWEAAEKEGIFNFQRYLGAPTDTMISKGAYLSKLENETFAKIIMGEVPLDQFDVFVSEWKKAGGEEIAQEVNEWYQSQ